MWENCETCAYMNDAIAKTAPYKRPDKPPPNNWNIPTSERIHVRPYKPPWTKPRIWWPMRERWERDDYHWNHPHLGIDEAKRNGEHWPDGMELLPYGLFNDMDIPRETKARMQEQYELAVFTMPDDEWTTTTVSDLPFPVRGFRGGKRYPTLQKEKQRRVE